MILPYVYKLIHKETGKYYFGYRSKNVLLGNHSEEDLGIKYFTSSGVIKNNFSEYNSEILAEFYTKEDAYDFEQDLIREHWGNELLINKHYHGKDRAQWKNTGHSEEARKKMTGLKRSPEFSEYRSKVMKGKAPWNKGLTKENDSRVADYSLKRSMAGNDHLIGKKRDPAIVEKIRQALIGYKHTDESRRNMSEGKKKKK